MKVIFILALILSFWTHQPWESLWSLILNDKVHLPEILGLIINISISTITAFFLVELTEWLKGSHIEIERLEPVNSPLKDGTNRKLLKIKVKAVANRWGKLFRILPNVHAFATLTVYIAHDAKSSYRAKWDNAPEPWEYDTPINQTLNFSGIQIIKKKYIPIELSGKLTGKAEGYPRINSLPLSLQPENLVPDDVVTASILAKHENKPEFLIYDPEYYFNRLENQCFEKKVYIKVVFKSSLGMWSEFFHIKNPNNKLEKFDIEKISQRLYEACI